MVGMYWDTGLDPEGPFGIEGSHAQVLKGHYWRHRSSRSLAQMIARFLAVGFHPHSLVCLGGHRSESY